MNPLIPRATELRASGFALERGHEGRERIAVLQVATFEKIPFRIFDEASQVPKGWIPCGSVRFCEGVLGRHLKPDYLPVHLLGSVSRALWIAGDIPDEDCFVKPLDQYKRFTGCHAKEAVAHGFIGPFFCSSTVQIENEWRYYITRGKVVAAGWYAGKDENEPPPDLSSRHLGNFWCGAADFARLHDGRLELIEAQHPCACGWYGDNHKDYVQWLVDGWDYIKRTNL